MLLPSQTESKSPKYGRRQWEEEQKILVVVVFTAQIARHSSETAGWHIHNILIAMQTEIVRYCQHWEEETAYLLRRLEAGTVQRQDYTPQEVFYFAQFSIKPQETEYIHTKPAKL